MKDRLRMILVVFFMVVVVCLGVKNVGELFYLFVYKLKYFIW